MATSEDTRETQDVPTDFNFDEWAASLNLSRKITQVLRQEELTSKEALSLIELKRLKGVEFSYGDDESNYERHKQMENSECGC